MALHVRALHVPEVQPGIKEECVSRCNVNYNTLRTRLQNVRRETRKREGRAWEKQFMSYRSSCEATCLSGAMAVAWAQNKSIVEPHTPKELAELRKKNNNSSNVNNQVVTAEGKIAPAIFA